MELHKHTVHSKQNSKIAKQQQQYSSSAGNAKKQKQRQRQARYFYFYPLINIAYLFFLSCIYFLRKVHKNTPKMNFVSVIDNTGFILETDILPLCNTKHFS